MATMYGPSGSYPYGRAAWERKDWMRRAREQARAMRHESRLMDASIKRAEQRERDIARKGTSAPIRPWQFTATGRHRQRGHAVTPHRHVHKGR